MTPAEAWAAKFGNIPPQAPTQDDPDSPAAKWAAKFGIHDHEAAHQEHVDAVNGMLSNVQALGRHLQNTFNPTPIPPGLDTTTPDPRNWAQQTLDRDKDAAASIASGLDKVPQSLAEGLNAIGPYGGMPTKQARPNPAKTLAGGFNDVSRGAMTLSEPLLGAAAVAAPFATAADVGSGMLAQTGTQAALNKAGVDPVYSEAAGNVAGLGAGFLAHSMFEGAGSAAVDAWRRKFGSDAVAKEAPNVEAGSSSSAEQAQSEAPAPAAQAPVAAVRSAGRAKAGAQSPFGGGVEAPDDENSVASGSGKLPAQLADAKPRYSYGPNQFDVNLDDDIDRASWITAQKTPSKQDAKYLKFVQDETGWTEDQVRAHGAKVREAVKQAAIERLNQPPLTDEQGYPISRGPLKIGAQRTTSEGTQDASEAFEESAAPDPVDESLVRKRPLLDEEGNPLLTKAGAPRERVYGTKIDLEQQPQIAKAIDSGAAVRADQRGEAPEVRSALMRDHVSKLNNSIAAGEPVHMVYDSSKAEDMNAPPDPATRQAEHEARLADPTLSQDAAKSIVPESYSVSKSNDVLVHGKSLDKQLSNGEKLVQLGVEHGLKTPYTPESAGPEMALDLRKGIESLPKAKQNFWALANRESPGTVFQRALERRGVDPIDRLEETKETLRLDRIEKILGPDEEPGVDAIRASAKTGTLKTPVDHLTPLVEKVKAKRAPKEAPAVTAPVEQQSSLEDLLAKSIEQAKAKKASSPPAEKLDQPATEPRFATEPAYGRSINIAVPGEQTRYKARYTVREASDVYPSHNPQSFEANPDYELQNERDYSNPQNAARVVRDSSKDNFDPEFLTSESPTAEHGAPVVDQRGNALGGNSRSMVIKRVYESKNGTAAKYRTALEDKAAQFGISPDDLQRFKDPVLVRERIGPVDAPTEVADYNRTAAADLTPSERAVADGKRISERTMGQIMGNLEQGDHESLADALRGDHGADILNSLESDGVVSPQEKAGLVDDRGNLTPEAKARVAKAMVGRLFEAPEDFERTTPEMRAKLDKIAPQVARVESREGWNLTPKVREALALTEEMRAAGTKNVEQFLKQDRLGEPRGEYSTEAQAIAKTLQKPQTSAAMAFRRYANEETNSRPGAPGSLFGSLSQREAFDDAFVKRRGEAGSAPILADLIRVVKDKLDGPDEGLKANYSGMGVLKRTFTPNAAEMRAAAPDDVYAALRTATAPKQQATVKMLWAMPKIKAALGGEMPVEDFWRAGQQDRLNATRDTWEAWARDAQSLGDKALVASLGKGVNGLLWNMQAKDGMSVDLLQQATALADRGDITGLRTMLSDTFEQAAANVSDVMTPEEFVAKTNSKGFSKALDVYKRELEPMLEQSGAKREGAFATTKGEFDTYFPLEPIAKNSGETRVNPLRERLNQIAGTSELGLAKDYDPTSKVIKDRLVSAFRSQDSKAAQAALESSGMIQRVTPGSDQGRVFVWNGKPLKAARIDINGVPYETAQAFANDLRPIFERGEMPSTSLIQRITGAGVNYALTGLMEPVFHSKNILGTMISRTPFVSKSLLGKTGEFIARPFHQIVKLANTESWTGDSFTPENMEAMRWLAKNGALGERFGSQTYSKALADITGGEVHRLSLGPVLSGPKGIDMRARIEMYKASMILEPNAGVADRTKMIDQLGQYTRALWSAAQRALPEWSSSFHVAGTTMYGNALKTGLGAEGIGERGLAGRATGMLMRGAVGTTALWALTYKSYTGQWPWQDSRSKFLKIPVNADDRYSKLGQALWGSGADQGYIDFSYVNPMAGRFGRVSGIDKAYENYVLGGNERQITEGAAAQMLNSAAHPFEGPLLKAAFVAATGNEPYITSLSDDRGKAAPQLFNVDRKGGFPHVKAAVKSLNPFVESLGESTGMLASDQVAKGSRAAQMVNDLLGAPFAKPSDPYRKQQFLQRQARGMEHGQETR